MNKPAIGILAVAVLVAAVFASMPGPTYAANPVKTLVETEVIPRLDQIISIVSGIDEDLQGKKCFYWVFDKWEPTDFPDGFIVRIKLTCPSTIPVDRRAFNAERILVRADGTFDTGQTLTIYAITIDGCLTYLSSPITIYKGGSTNLLIETNLVQVAAHNWIDIHMKTPPGQSETFDLWIEAIGEMPQAAEVTVVYLA